MTRSPFLSAIFNPVNLLILAIAIVAGLIAAWWLAPIGLLFWLIMVIVIASDPGLKMTFTRQNRQPLSQRFQAKFDRMDRARFSIFNTLAGFTPKQRKYCESVSTSLDALVDHIYQLSLRMSSMDNNFVIQKLTNTSVDDIAKMQNNIENSTDATTRKEYESTLQSLQNSQNQMKAIESLLSRFEAQLTGSSNIIDNIVTGIVGLQGRSEPQIQEKVTSLLSTLQTEETELQHFESELNNSSAV
jgi:hypothetical protein